jgi:hypothetical protein
VSGVRSSWLTTEMNSSLSRSTALRRPMSLKLTTAPAISPWTTSGAAEDSTSTVEPSLRCSTSWAIRRRTPCAMTSWVGHWDHGTGRPSNPVWWYLSWK